MEDVAVSTAQRTTERRQRQRLVPAQRNSLCSNGRFPDLDHGADATMRAGVSRLLVPDVVPIGYAEEAQPSWAVLTAFVRAQSNWRVPGWR